MLCEAHNGVKKDGLEPYSRGGSRLPPIRRGGESGIGDVGEGEILAFAAMPPITGASDSPRPLATISQTTPPAPSVDSL